MFQNYPVKIMFLLSLCVALFVQAETKQVVTEMQVTNNDTVYRFSYLYNNLAQPVVETKARKVGVNWENVSQTEWTRQTDIVSRQVERVWLNNKWNDSYITRSEIIDSKIVETQLVVQDNSEIALRMIESYFLNNIKTKRYEYLQKNGAWEKSLETYFYYASPTQPDSIRILQFSNGELKLSYKTIYGFYADGSLKTFIVQQKDGAESVYSNISKSVYSYKSSAVSSLRNYSWNKSSSLWENNTKLDYEYNAAGSTTDEISWRWNSVYWEQVLRYNYLYDTENQLSKKLVSIPLYRDWRNTNSINYFRNSNSRNMTIESVYGFWGGKAGDKLNTHISFPFNDETIIRKAENIQLTYAPFVDSSTGNATQKNLMNVYPNPSKGIFYISNFEATGSVWTLTGMNGNVMRNSTPNANSSVVDITDMPLGIYLLIIRSKAGIETHKIVKY